MSTTTTPEQELEALQARHVELTAELADLDQQIEQEREGMGRAVAKGQDGSAHRAKARDLGEQAEGIRRALPIVEAEIEDARARKRQEDIAASLAKHDRTIEAAAEAYREADRALQEFAEKTFLPLMQEAWAAAERARNAERNHHRLVGTPITPYFLVQDVTVQKYRRVEPFAKLMGGLIQNQPYLFPEALPVQHEPAEEEVPLAFR